MMAGGSTISRMAFRRRFNVVFAIMLRSDVWPPAIRLLQAADQTFNSVNAVVRCGPITLDSPQDQ